MSDLVAWLIKILDEYEQAAERASGTISKMQNDDYGRLLVPPSWVLADIAAKRAILDLHKPFGLQSDMITGCDICSYRDVMEELQVAWPCETVRLLASANADRPGYDESWKP